MLDQPTRWVSVVMPAYNELPNLRELVPAIRASLASVPDVQSEILVVVPSFSPEAELAEIIELGARPIVRGPSDTFGDAIRTGIAALAEAAQYVIVMDADGSHDPATIPRLLAAATDADVVVASRYVTGGSTDNSAILRAMSRSLNLAYRYVIGIHCKDISTNYKMYRAADLRRVKLTTSNFDIVEELMFRLKLLHGKGFTVREIPDHFSERKFGVTKRRLGPFIISYFKTLAVLSWRSRKVER